MTDYQKQDKYKRRKSIIYQNTVFKSFGSEYSFIHLTHALIKTVDDFNTNYEDVMHPKHGILILLIKYYTTETNAVTFTPIELWEYYKQPHLNLFFSYFANSHKSFVVLIRELMHLKYLNPQGHSYAPTLRIRSFMKQYDQHCKDLFKEPER